MPIQDNKPIRFPLVGSYNTRLFFGSTGSESGTIGIGVIGDFIIGGSPQPLSLDQRFINAIPDRIDTPLTQNSKFYCYKRPGFEENTVPSAGNIGTAVRIWTGFDNSVISAFGDTNSELFQGGTSLGTVTGVVNQITETVVGSTPTLVFTTDANKLYYYQDGGAITEVTDGDYPSNNSMTVVGNPAHMDGFTFVLTEDGKIYNSDLNSISAWTSTSFILANTYPDKGVALARYKELLVAFGKETAEFFRDVGNANGSVLQKVQEASIKIGAVSSTAVCSLEDNIAWVAGSDAGTFSVYILDGYKPQRISDNVVDALLAQRGDTPIYLTSAKINGKTLIFVIFNDTTMVYCLEDKMWHEWEPATDILWYQFAASSSATGALFTISRTSTNGKVYVLSPASPVYTDDEETYPMTIQTSKIDLDNENRKFMDRLTIVGDSPTGTSTLSVSWSDDDYNTYSTPRTVTLSNNRKYLSNLGAFRRRAFLLSNEDEFPVRLEALELNVRQGVR